MIQNVRDCEGLTEVQCPQTLFAAPADIKTHCKERCSGHGENREITPSLEIKKGSGAQIMGLAIAEENHRAQAEAGAPQSTSHPQIGATGHNVSPSRLVVGTVPHIQPSARHWHVSTCKWEIFALVVYIWFLNCANL